MSLVVPDQELIKDLLEQLEVKHFVDEEGDLAAPYETFRTYFMFRGEENQRTLAVRTFYDRVHTLDDKPRLLDVIDDWNRRALWPKVYSHTGDNGVVRLIGESQMLIADGIGKGLFFQTTVTWIRAAVEFDRWLVEQLG